MEFVGRSVRKEFEGFGVFFGVVKSYDSSSGFFEIGYEDGDSEEIEFSELTVLLEMDGVLGDHSLCQLDKKPSRVGRKPKKRRRVLGSSNSGNENDFSSSLGNAVTTDDSNLDSVVDGELRNDVVVVVENLTKNLDLNANNNNNVSSSCENAITNNGGLDLNCGLNALDDDARENVDGIDLNLNLDLNEEDERVSNGEGLVDHSGKKGRCFDLNMDLGVDESKNQDDDLGGYLKESSGDSHKRENCDGEVERTQIEGATLNSSPLEVSGGTDPQGNIISIADESPVLDYHATLGKTYPGKRRGRKRRKLSDSLNSAEKSVLRRSNRKQAKVSTEEYYPNVISYDGSDNALLSPVISVVPEDQPTISGCEESEEPSILPPQLELPPSTGNMNLEGLPALGLFSVYSFLRSFSTSLFLSPFELGDFVASIRSKSPSLLIDSIHVSLLQTLRKHLEFQSSEGSPSATNCLRDLNWDLLDLITWPIFMVEYLLMKPGFDLALLKLFKTNYYKQPEFAKVEVLQYLCDDVIEAEAISSELNRRALVGDPTNIMDSDQNTKLVTSKKRKTMTAISGSSCMSEEVIDETADWNSDECCLCKTDGNLICCDGCPAAFHSKCVGIATNLLPEGDWFCPECVVDKNNPEMNLAKSIRGADLLGVDPHGRLYYSSCGYLLVSDIGDAETSFHYYHMNDLTALIDALNLLNGPYRTISSAITKHWDLYKKLHRAKSNMDSEKREWPLAHSAGSSEISEAVTGIQNSSKTELHCLKESAVVLPQGKNVDSSSRDLSKGMTRKGMSEQLEIGYVNSYSFARVALSVAGEWTRKRSDKISQTPTKSLEELISAQMKAISKISVDFCWSNIQNLSVDARKEQCGWCLSCKFPTDDSICLFVTNNTTVLENFTSDLLGLGSRINRSDRLMDVMCHILCIEDRLHGLLLGPWLNPHFPKLYRKSFMGASDIVPVKDLLLMLESNIRLLALSDDWLKHVDSVVTVGSASHVVTSKLRVPSRNVVGRKRAKSSGSEPHSSKNASSGLGLFWWRGGRLTRKLFNWKVLPQSLACKAARQGGGKKIEGILYPENSDFPKRNKALTWRASVESAVTVEQLALQVRELDANIRWEDIENTSHLAKMDKESLRSMRSFKKAIVRRKVSEGTAVKFLLDFGKRRFIPDTVVKHGSKLEDSSSGRKKYWVGEPYVPLFLLKTFEERRIALKSSKMSPGSLPVSRRVLKPFKEEGFSYLLSKAERAENSRCGHCNKDVLRRDAISCQYCEGFFHKRHVRKTSGSMYTCNKCHNGNYVKAGTKKGESHSQKAKEASSVTKPVQSKITKKTGKKKQSQAKKRGGVVVVPLRRSARTAKVSSVHGKKTQVKKKKQPKKKQKKSPDKKKQMDFSDEVKIPKAKRGRPRKVIKKDIFQKKRSEVHTSTYWLNGLLLSRKLDDGRVMDFRTKNHLVPFELLDSSMADQPKCCLCFEPEFRSLLNYITCETCGDWYHGDAFGLKDEQIRVLIGFKCHKCRNRAPPTCPYSKLNELKTEEGSKCADKVSSDELLNKKSNTIEEQKVLFSDENCQKEPHVETEVGSKEDQEHSKNSSSKDILITGMSDPYKNIDSEKESLLTHNLTEVVLQEEAN